MADVKVALEDVLEDLESREEADQDRRDTVSTRRAAGGWSLMIAAGSGRGSIHRMAGASNSPQPTFERLTYRRGDVAAARFSPDGQTVLFSAQWGDEPMTIFSMRPGSRESRSLGLPPGRILSISSTGEMAILMGDARQRRELWRACRSPAERRARFWRT